jgi:hypothetical protein
MELESGSQSMPLPAERAVVMLNPVTTGRADGLLFLQSLSEIDGIYPNIVFTHPNPNVTKTRLIKAITASKEPALVIGYYGDGGDAHAAEALTSDEVMELDNAPVYLPWWGGNANDFATQVNDEATYRQDVAGVLRDGRPVSLNPLQITLEREGQQRKITATSYFGLGPEGKTARYMASGAYNRLKHEYHRAATPAEWMIAGLALKNSEYFRRIDARGRIVRAYDLVFSNGRRMAKHDMFPVELPDPAMARHEIATKRLDKLAPFLTHLAMGGTAEPELIFDGENEEFTLLNDVDAQFDGEYLRIRKNTKVRAERSQRKYKVWSTSLRPFPGT